MRRTALALAVALLAACGSSSPPPKMFGGYVHTYGTAVVFPPTDCTVLGIPGTTSASGVLVALTDFPDVCTWVTDIQFCGSHASSTFVVGLAARGAIGATAPEISTGSYPVLTGPPSTSTFAGAIGSAVETNASCGTTTATDLAFNGGRMVITALDETHVAGTVDVSLTDGSVYQQPFDVLRCAPPASICRLLPGGTCTPWTCVGAP